MDEEKTPDQTDNKEIHSEEKSTTQDKTKEQTENVQDTNFLKKHRLLIIGVLLYIIVYIIRDHFPVLMDSEAMHHDTSKWGLDIKRIYVYTDFLRPVSSGTQPENRILKNLPVDFLYYGIADAASFIEYGVIFAMSIITYAAMLLDIGLKYLGIKEKPLGERYIISYLYGNVILYPVALLICFLEPRIVDGLYSAGKLGDIDMNILFKIIFLFLFFVIVVIFILGFLLPMLVNNIFFFLYFIGFDYVKAAIIAADRFLGNLLGKQSILHDMLSAFVFIVLVFVYNLIAETLLERCQKISVMPAARISNKLRK